MGVKNNRERTHPAGPARRGPKPLFHADQVLDRALELLDAEGLAGVNIRRLTTELKVSPMTLYTYFASKEALIDAMLVRALIDVQPTIDPQRSWQEQMAAAMTDLHAAFVAHPGIIELLLNRPVSEPSLDRLRETLFDILLTADFGPDETVEAITMLVGHALGTAVLESRRAKDTTDETERLHRLAPDQHPRLAQLADRYANRSSAASYAYALPILINSLEQLRSSAVSCRAGS